MATIVRTRKGLLTKRITSATEWMGKNEDLFCTPLEFEKTKRETEIRLALKVCEEKAKTLESSLDSLAEAFEDLKERSEDDEIQFDKYTSSAQEVIMKLQAHRERLLRTLYNCSDLAGAPEIRQQEATSNATVLSPLSVSKLPIIPIPTFSGRRWEWDNFWALFKANVHDQSLTDLQKFNYLLTSLSGQAKQSISRFQVTSENYSKALEHLKARYGQKDGIIRDLHRNLSSCNARGPRTEDQRQLFERLSAIASQLQDQGEHLDNYLTVRTSLQKFHGRIQTAATKNLLRVDSEGDQQRSNDTDWKLNLWLGAIDGIISQEETMKDMLSDDLGRDASPRHQVTAQAQGSCEYCRQKGHRWNSCSRIPTPLAKRKFLMDSNRCLNCGSGAHRVSSCPSSSCRICHEKHHTLICSKNPGPACRQESDNKTPPTLHAGQPSSALAKTSKQKLIKSAKQHVIKAEPESLKPEEHSTIVLQLYKQQRTVAEKRDKVLLLVGKAKVLDSKNRLHQTAVLLDTGSELSFISEQFTRQLGLPASDSTSILISTFGAPSPSLKTCDIIMVQLYDIEGCQHELRLHQSEYITGNLEQANLNQEDLRFISQHGIELSLQNSSIPIQPQILLGCDYLWNFIMPLGKMIMPSGLQLIPTKFGYIISGSQPHEGQESGKVFTIRGVDDEKEAWDRYWSLESAGTEEFTGSKRSEWRHTNEKVLQDFRSSVEPRHDGYYVRLPWKPNHETLPDNKAITLKRLHKISDMYEHKKTPCCSMMLFSRINWKRE